MRCDAVMVVLYASASFMGGVCVGGWRFLCLQHCTPWFFMALEALGKIQNLCLDMHWHSEEAQDQQNPVRVKPGLQHVMLLAACDGSR